MISPLLAKICKLETHTPDVFEAPCTVCVKTDPQHMKLPHLGEGVSVCRECCVLKYQVFSIESKWLVWFEEKKKKREEGDIDERPKTIPFLDIVFDGPPRHESGRFVEVEDPTGKSVCAGEWIDRGNGFWALRIRIADCYTGGE